ncbi:SulP family inorganic anion transporter [Paenarthrobacter sp. OM7]|uniref:SulP family inorganic anion transporter n=1 Tax=Paenarthrobacter sp. OM7 TaxID=3041264 RepID=UPI002468CDD1|nr:SulP family inorganic anion transporter [Paenarthrobacter sp. OM7]WGM20439.1 SulP family inorganic anion transporter [Paenarthrobacter sp. OM7]
MEQSTVDTAGYPKNQAWQVKLGAGLVRLPTFRWRQEITAGITLTAIAVPLNIGYAQIAGLPPTAGLYSLIFPAIVFALLASTRQLVVSPDAAASSLVAASVIGFATLTSPHYVEVAAAQAIVGGVLFLLCWALKLGAIVSFLSEPMLAGFVGGLALNVLLSQVVKMLGLKGVEEPEFAGKLFEAITHIGTVNPAAVLLSLGCLLVLLAGGRISRAVPWPLVVLVLASAVVAVFGLQRAGISVLGPIAAGLPVPNLPLLSWSEWMGLFPSAAALTIVGMAEALLLARRYADRYGYTTNPNQDLFALGAANMASGTTGGFTIGSSASRSAAMEQGGSRTQYPAIIAAVLTILLMIFGTGLLEHIPSPAVGAIVAVAVIRLVGFADFRMLWHRHRYDFTVGIVCFVGVLLIGPIRGILLALFLALLGLARNAAATPVEILNTSTGSWDPQPDNLAQTSPVPPSQGRSAVVGRVIGPLFFANAARFTDSVKRLTESPDPDGETSSFLFDCSTLTDIDTTGLEALAAARDRLEEHGASLRLEGVRPNLQEMLTNEGFVLVPPSPEVQN